MYQAWAEPGGAMVAIKVAHLGTASGLLREAAAQGLVGPPHAPEVLETGLLADGRSYIVMERPPHPTLAELLSRTTGPRDLEWFYPAADAILGALEAVHRRGLVHLDLKPEHILLDLSRPHAWLIDFGLARPPGAAAPSALPPTLPPRCRRPRGRSAGPRRTHHPSSAPAATRSIRARISTQPARSSTRC